MVQQTSPKVGVAIRIDSADAGAFDDIVRALARSALADGQRHAPFAIVTGSIGQGQLGTLNDEPRVVPASLDQRGRSLGG